MAHANIYLKNVNRSDILHEFSIEPSNKQGQEILASRIYAE